MAEMIQSVFSTYRPILIVFWLVSVWGQYCEFVLDNGGHFDRLFRLIY